MENREIKEDKWSYFEKNDDWLLRYRLSGKSNEIIRFELLNTKTVSENDEMYCDDYKKTDLIDVFGVPENYDIYTFLDTLFETKNPECIFSTYNKQFELVVFKHDNTKHKIVLKQDICNDIEFLKKNREKKIMLIKSKMEAKFKEINLENEKLKKRNEDLEKEFNQIVDINKKLSSENEKISTALSKLKEVQGKAIEQLQDLTK